METYSEGKEYFNFKPPKIMAIIETPNNMNV